MERAGNEPAVETVAASAALGAAPGLLLTAALGGKAFLSTLQETTPEEVAAFEDSLPRPDMSVYNTESFPFTGLRAPASRESSSMRVAA